MNSSRFGPAACSDI